MSEQVREGDIITVRFDAERYVPAHVVRIEPVTLHDIVFLRVYDQILEAGEGGYDASGTLRPRSHPPIDRSSVAVDPLAVTSGAILDSDPMVVDHVEVEQEDLLGYRVWVARRRASAERRGMLRYESAEGESTGAKEADEGGVDETKSSGEQIFESVDPSHGEGGATESNADHDSDSGQDQIEVEVMPWHETVFDLPIERILADLGPTFERESMAETTIAEAIRARSADIAGKIGELIKRLVDEGDYAAREDLLDAGEPAIVPIGQALRSAATAESAGDLAQILADSGIDEAYEVLTSELAHRLDSDADSEATREVSRSWLYVVMLTGGEPDPLRDHLGLIERIDDAELSDDRDAAVAAIAEGGGRIDESKHQRSSDPFGL